MVAQTEGTDSLAVLLDVSMAKACSAMSRVGSSFFSETRNGLLSLGDGITYELYRYSDKKTISQITELQIQLLVQCS